MEVAIIGLGRMGAGVAERLLAAGHTVSVYNRTPEKALPLIQKGATQAQNLKELVEGLQSPRILWLYLPAGSVTQEYVNELLPLLSQGDCIIDGGNTRFSDTVSRAKICATQGVQLVDVGTSGGLGGRSKGYCLMIGGNAEVVARLSPLWQAIAQVDGWKRVGPTGAGHYVKMVHNAIEYGMMQSYGEGMELLSRSQFSTDLDFAGITNVWQHGSIITSYLGELLAESLVEHPGLREVGERIDDNGEGKWAIEEALNLGVPVPAISAALFERYASRRPESFARKVIAILRYKFGGHATEGIKQ